MSGSEPWGSSFGQGPNPPSQVSKKRRYATASDEEVMADIVKRHARIGWPCLTPRPAEDHSINNEDHYIKDWLKTTIFTVMAILDAQSIPHEYVNLVNRRPVTGAQQPLRPTVLILAGAKAGSCYNAVLRLVRAIQDAQGAYDGDIYVEIMEWAYDVPLILPIKADEAVLLSWDGLGAAIINVLSQYVVKWKLLSLVWLEPMFGRRYPASEPVMTALIEAWDPENNIWEVNIRPRLKTLLANTDIKNIEIWQAVPHSVTNEQVCRKPLWEMYRTMQALEIGESIGFNGVPNFGTLGGFITLEDPVKNGRTQAILTNFHVVKNCAALTSRLTPHPTSKILQSLDIPEPSTDCLLHSPCEADVRDTLEGLEHEIKRQTDRIMGRDLKPTDAPSISARAEMGDEKSIKAMRVHEKKMECLRSEIETISDAIRENEYVAGSVRAVSGFQYLQRADGRKSNMDWALVRVDSDRPVDLRFNPKLSRGMRDLPSWTNHRFEHWRKISSFEGEDVLKVGKMTGWTHGKINRARAWLALSKEEGQSELWENEYGTVVECMRVENLRKDTRAFSRPGDSGSMVLDMKDGACVGLLFGGDRVSSYGIMMSMEDVIQSIETVTGCKVVEPKLAA